jgi:hypothetical protein
MHHEEHRFPRHPPPPCYPYRMPSLTHIVASIMLAVPGIACFVYFRSLSHSLATFMAKQFRDAYGAEATVRGWDNPEITLNKYYYRAAVAFIGGFLLLISIHLLLS